MHLESEERTLRTVLYYKILVFCVMIQGLCSQLCHGGLHPGVGQSTPRESAQTHLLPAVHLLDLLETRDSTCSSAMWAVMVVREGEGCERLIASGEGITL